MPQPRRSWMRTLARPCSWIRPGMLWASGPSNIAGKRVRTSMSRVMRPCPAARRARQLAEASGPAASASLGSLGGLGRSRRLGALLRASRPAARRLRSVGIRRPRSPRPQVERLGIDDDLATSRREDPDERANGRQVEAAERAAVDREDLGLADPIDVAHGPEVGPVGAADRAADDLVPVVRTRAPGPGRARRPIRDRRRAGCRRRRAR